MSRKLEVISVDGPFTRRPSGEFREGLPVMRKCPPYWVVRVLHGTVLSDYERLSEAAARQFADDIRSGRIVEDWGGGTGFIFVEGPGR